jgi:hypothetical protein
MSGVAQPGRASGSGPEGRWFESSRPDHPIPVYFDKTGHSEGGGLLRSPEITERA